MSAKKSDNGFDGLVAIQLCTRSWPGIVNLTKEDLGLDKVPEFFHLGNKKLYPAEWRQAFNRKISEARRVLNDNTLRLCAGVGAVLPQRPAGPDY